MKKLANVSIRPHKVKDAKDFFRILSEGNFELFPMNVASIEAEKRFLRKSVADFRAKTHFNFAILLEDKVVGAVGIIPESTRPYNAEIGYFVDRNYHGQGLAFKGACLAEAYAREHLPQVNRLQAYIVTTNLPSIRVVEKAGFAREGILKDYLKVGEKFYDAFIFGKIIR